VSRLTIEYLLEGSKRGYNYTSPTHLFDDRVLKAVWRNAMPRGQGWAADQYIGSRSIKCFPLGTGQVAVSEVTVTDMEDENGRRGIRRAVVDVMSPTVFAHHIQSRVQAYPGDVQAAVNGQFDRVKRSFPRLKKQMPLVLAYPFTSAQDWWLMEALVLHLTLTPLRQMRRWGDVIPFTTLALSHRNDSKIVALPIDEAAQITDVPVVDLTN
jgi:hypothetical protein